MWKTLLSGNSDVSSVNGHRISSAADHPDRPSGR
jgi:hypothetical protein